MNAIIEIEGLLVSAHSVEKTGIKPGEMYLARRNTGWKLLTCKQYHPYDPKTCEEHYTRSRSGEKGMHLICGVVFPEEIAYPFYDYECYKLKEN